MTPVSLICYSILSFFVGFTVGTYICTCFSVCGPSIEHTKYILGEFINDIGYRFSIPVKYVDKDL